MCSIRSDGVPVPSSACEKDLVLAHTIGRLCNELTHSTVNARREKHAERLRCAETLHDIRRGDCVELQNFHCWRFRTET